MINPIARPPRLAVHIASCQLAVIAISVFYSFWLINGWLEAFISIEALIIVVHNLLLGIWLLMSIWFLGDDKTRAAWRLRSGQGLIGPNLWKALVGLLLISVPSLLSFHLWLISQLREIGSQSLMTYLSATFLTVSLAYLALRVSLGCVDLGNQPDHQL